MTPTKEEQYRRNVLWMQGDLKHQITALACEDFAGFDSAVETYLRHRKWLDNEYANKTQEDIDSLREMIVAFCGSVNI